MDDRERQVALLDRYWDRLDRDPATPPPDDLDPATADLARHLVATLRPPAPEAAFTADLRQRLAAGAATARPRGDASLGARPSLAGRRSPRPAWAARRGLLADGASRVAAAALILGLLVASLLLLRGLPQREAFARPTAGPSPLATVAPRPTPQAAATPSAAPAVPGSWRAVGAMGVARSGHTATLLNDGRVLVVGGWKESAVSLALTSAELFDPATGGWSNAAPLAIGRANHAATLLRDGRVLVVGGLDGTNRDAASRSAELYDPTTDLWSPVAPPATPFSSPLALTLRDGTVLVLAKGGGSGERYDPLTDRWTIVETPPTFRGFALAMLADGSLLTAGGTSGAKPNSLAQVDRYEALTDRWLRVVPMATPRAGAAAVTLPGGQILVIGGGNTTSGILAPTERYDPRADAWTPTAPMAIPRTGPLALTLPDGRVLVFGGASYPEQTKPLPPEIYDPATDSWQVGEAPALARDNATVTLLRDGRVLVTGGEPIDGGRLLASAEVYMPPAAIPARRPGTPVALPVGIRGDRLIAAPFLWNSGGPGPDYAPQLAPDDRHVAYFVASAPAPANRLLVNELAGGATRELTPTQGALYASVRWSPDGRRLAYVRATSAGARGVVAEVLVTDDDLANPRPIYRYEDPQATAGPLLRVSQWSLDGRSVLIGGELGTQQNATWVRADGSGGEPVRAEPFPCGIMPPASRTLYGATTAPDGSFRVCTLRGGSVRDPVLAGPGDSLVLVREEVATGERRALALVHGIAYGITISPDGAWITVWQDKRRPTGDAGFARHSWPSIIRSDGTGGLRLVGGEPYASLSGWGWADGGKVYFLGCPADCAGRSTGYLYELDAASATVRAVTRGWEARALIGVTHDGRALLVRGDPDRPELHLIEPAPGDPAPRGTIPPGPIPEAAIDTVRAFMDARIARDEPGARAALDPNLAATLDIADLLPPADQAWSSFQFALSLRDTEGRLLITVQVYPPAGVLEQQIILETRGGRWSIAWLGPLTTPR